MKYLVMECHPAYAVLMDEASRLVHAANLHYEVGQVVESPVLLQEQTTLRPRISMTMRRCIAAAACIALVAGGGALYYRGNYTAYTSIVVSAAADMRMEVSRTGKVLSVEPLNQDAALLLADYDCKGKDQITVTNELIDRAVDKGYVQKGDTVHVYYQKEKNKDPEKYREQVQDQIASHELTADVHENAKVAALTPPQETALPKPTETVPETDAVPLYPGGHAAADPVPHAEPGHESAPEPVKPTAPAAPKAPEAAPAVGVPEPRKADPVKEKESPHPATPAEKKPETPAAPAPAPKAEEPAAKPNPPEVQKPASPDEKKPVPPAEPAPKEEKSGKDPTPPEPQKQEPAAPAGHEVKPHEQPAPAKPAELPHAAAPAPHEAAPAPEPAAPAPAAPPEPAHDAPAPPAAP